MKMMFTLILLVFTMAMKRIMLKTKMVNSCFIVV